MRSVNIHRTLFASYHAGATAMVRCLVLTCAQPRMLAADRLE